VHVAEVKVFVDDAVLGRLPDVCARDGVLAYGRLTCRSPVGGASHAGVLWLLLLLAGPIGWIVAAVLAGRGGEELTVEVPYSDRAYDRMRAHRALRVTGLLVLLGGLVGVYLLDANIALSDVGLGLALLLPIGGLVAYVAGAYRMWRERVEVRLDGSRRWVTLANVHPDFGRACDAAASAPDRAHSGVPDSR
jgi:hypothetical protein